MRLFDALPTSRINIPERLIAVAGIIAIAVILGSVATLTLVRLSRTNDRLDSLSRDTAVGDAYNRMLASVATAIGHSEQFQASGNPQESRLLLQSIQDVLTADAEVKTLGDESDRKLITDLEQRYGAQLANAAQLLTNPSLTPADTTPTDPFVLSDIASALASPTIAKRTRSSIELVAINQSFDATSRLLLGAFAVSLPVLGILLFMIMRYERKDAVRAAELLRLGEAALTDGLTGLGNHRAFQDDLKRELARASRTERPLTVAMLDIDDFKMINDTHGHMRGDDVLSQLGQLMTYMRGEDRAYRVGGDEFALIMPDTEAKAASTALERLRTAASTAIEGLTISIGVSSNAIGARNAANLRDSADTALYEAKHRGKNQVVVYNLELDSGTAVTAAKMNAVREVLKTGIVAMWFQPIFKLGTKELLAFEALLRLPQAPELSGPEDAFDIAQHMGRSRDLDLLCTGRALDAARELPDHTKIFINLDPATLMHSDFSPGELLAMVRARGIDPAKVVFEITEKTTAPMARITQQVSGLQACGFGVALDDVGSGNSGLEMLRLMKFDYVKIDRSVILDAMDGGPGRAVILAIVAFARETGAFMIAEGIENSAMLESIKFDEAGLRKFWVQGVQGFMFGEPRSSMNNPDSTPAKAA